MTEADDMLAAEYVIGTLTPAERRVVEAMIQADPDVAAAVAGWTARLAPLADAAPEIAPAPALWPRIARAIAPVAANDNRAGRWRWATIAAAMVALVSSGLAVQGWRRPTTTPMSMVAALTPDGSTPALLVGWHARTGRYEVRPLAMPAAAGHVHQLWLIVDGAGPRSMGLIGAGGRWIDGRAMQPGQAATIAVSVEPAGGSPTGLPTGPVVLTGRLMRMPETA